MQGTSEDRIWPKSMSTSNIWGHFTLVHQGHATPSNQPTMKERIHILQAKFLLRTIDTPDDTLISLLPLYGGSALKPILIKLIDASSKQFIKIIYKNLLKTAVQTLTLSFSPLAVLN
ncbi:hypothetical protein G6F33_013429 [Rhizopus arrhizus]|nr:hypothetical protein G6F24_003619 [Rhizopus arrhizus]KAG0897522.1 hypothetical protein G6F33_013429 [Rhizopus arrhizus]KAG0953850.1 hypothetical protein G6F32_003915 [Rhizopus arrhizus]